MKRLLVAAVLLGVFAGGYYFRSFFFKTAPDRSLYQHTLQSGNFGELYRFASVVEAQMRQLPVLQSVSSDLEIKSAPAIVNRQKTAA
jgi:hypothetical protein